ncbi:hypothetical protein L209DRAFT_735592 [Thermothelomyces heterothallicus CBS 203.75]
MLEKSAGHQTLHLLNTRRETADFQIRSRELVRELLHAVGLSAVACIAARQLLRISFVPKGAAAPYPWSRSSSVPPIPPKPDELHPGRHSVSSYPHHAPALRSLRSLATYLT